jgi:DNA-directed RNA polymerase subunit RPC12/RpoP
MVMAEARKQVSKKLRFEIFKRDGFVCQYCGATPPGSVLHVDHIIPVALGGKNDQDNLITSCESCNLGKHATPLSSVPESLLNKSERIAEQEAQIKGYNAVLQERAWRIESEAWDVARALECNPKLESYSRANLMSIKKFLERLPLQDVIDSAETAVGRHIYSKNRTFTYFCGICWSKIREAENGPR